MNRDKVMICIFVAIAAGIFIYFQSLQETDKLVESTAKYRTTITKANRPRVVTFTAPWCAPCQQFKPILKRVLVNYSQSVDCDIINVDDKSNKDVVHAFSIKQIPATFVFDRQGNMIFRRVGYVDPEELDYYLKKTII